MAKVKKLAQFLENITVAENLTGVASAILNSESDSRCEKLKLSIQYYLDGTQNGFLNYGSGMPVLNLKCLLNNYVLN